MISLRTGSLHPRLKEPVGRRLAVSLIALQYGGNGTVSVRDVHPLGQTSSVHLIRGKCTRSDWPQRDDGAKEVDDF
jgi:hypothetical protein